MVLRFVYPLTKFVFLRQVYPLINRSVQPAASLACLSLRYLGGRFFVLDLTPGSQAHMDKFICPGDIIDEINGTSLRNSKNGQVSSTVQRYAVC